MKRFLILIVLAVLTPLIYGQFTLGPKIGYSSSKLSTDIDDITESIRHNYQVGAFFRMGKRIFLQPEVAYATSGGNLQLEEGGFKESIKFKTLAVPVLMGFKLINAKVINLRVMAGPAANFILSKEVESDELIQDPLQDSNFKDISWGMDVGAGIDVFFLALDVRYEFGLNNIFIPDEGGQEQKIKGNLFIVSLGFKLL